jgi:hypothetical protein
VCKKEKNKSSREEEEEEEPEAVRMRAVPLRGSFFLLLPVFPSLKKHGLLNTLPPDSFSILFGWWWFWWWW